MTYVLWHIRAFSSSLLHVIITRSQLPFFKIFSNFVCFCPKLQIFFLLFLPFFKNFFCPFSEKSHARPYFPVCPAHVSNRFKFDTFLLSYFLLKMVSVIKKNCRLFDKNSQITMI